MAQIYLFDWGDTLMVDFPTKKGKMCDWDEVLEIRGAAILLQNLSATHKVYIATGAEDSSEYDIELALSRVDLMQYISGIFCKSNLGVGKNSVKFFPLILASLNVSASSVTMVGDSYKRDIEPAENLGLNAIWFNPSKMPISDNCKSITNLDELCL